MYEQLSALLIQILSRTVHIFANKLVPLVGVGGSVETLEKVPWESVLFGLVVLAALGVVFGVALAIVAARFIVKTDPKVDQVRETLPGANCGACGFAGCMGYAEHVVGNPDVAVNLCAPGKAAVAEKIADITGKKQRKLTPRSPGSSARAGRASASGNSSIPGYRIAQPRYWPQGAINRANTAAWDMQRACAPVPLMRSR
jgi:hypothetical protein